MTKPQTEREALQALIEATQELCDWASESREFMPCVDDPQDEGYAVAHHLRESEKTARAAVDAAKGVIAQTEQTEPEVALLRVENKRLKRSWELEQRELKHAHDRLRAALDAPVPELAPARETFDPDAVRALLAAVHRVGPSSMFEAAIAVEASERKP